MKYAELLRAQAAKLEETRSALLAELDTIAADETRSADEITARADEITTEAKAIGEDIKAKVARAAELEAIDADRDATPKGPNFIPPAPTVTPGDARSMSYLVPTHLDPTIIVTNAGTSNAVRAISRVVTLTRPGDTSWQGITSDGVTASFDAQLTEVSDDSPTFGQPTVPVHKAQALIQGSIEFFDDAFTNELLMMFADAKDRLEGAKHCTGTGTNEPTGIFTALDANTNVEILSTPPPASSRRISTSCTAPSVSAGAAGKWLMNPIWNSRSRTSAPHCRRSTRPTSPRAPRVCCTARPSSSPTTLRRRQTTTVRDNEIVFGDFSNYLIVDKPGSFAIEYIPHLFNTANNLPDGRRGWYAHWRTGADSVNDLGFRLLQDKTSA
jgi:hypothetical protein